MRAMTQYSDKKSMTMRTQKLLASVLGDKDSKPSPIFYSESSVFTSLQLPWLTEACPSSRTWAKWAVKK